MNRLYVILVLVLLQACNSVKEYNVTTIQNGQVTIDGKPDEKLWDSSSAITSFSNPWNTEVCPTTSFSMLRDREYLYFNFDAKDAEILIDTLFAVERDLEKEDRVEIFFSRDKDMREYYCFEMDAKGRILAYSAKNYRQFNFGWEPPAGFNVAANIYSGGYSVEGAIPVRFIEGLSINGELYMGVYRAEFARKDSLIVENWLTWIDPKTAAPDFHVPASLGKLVLKDAQSKK